MTGPCDTGQTGRACPGPDQPLLSPPHPTARPAPLSVYGLNRLNVLQILPQLHRAEAYVCRISPSLYIRDETKHIGNLIRTFILPPRRYLPGSFNYNSRVAAPERRLLKRSEMAATRALLRSVLRALLRAPCSVPCFSAMETVALQCSLCSVTARCGAESGGSALLNM